PPAVGCGELTGLDASSGTTLGAVALGRKPGRLNDVEITVYKAMGVAMEDMVAANLAHQKAKREGGGDLMAWGTLPSSKLTAQGFFCSFRCGDSTRLKVKAGTPGPSSRCTKMASGGYARTEFSEYSIPYAEVLGSGHNVCATPDSQRKAGRPCTSDVLRRRSLAAEHFRIHEQSIGKDVDSSIGHCRIVASGQTQ